MTRLLLSAAMWMAMSFGFAGAAIARDAPPLSDDPVLEARVMAVAEELRCLVCQNETIAASQADLAKDLRGQIREKLRHGETEAQILDFMVQRYGAFVRYRPAFDATTALLWIGPFLLLVGAAFVLMRNVRRRRVDAPRRKIEDMDPQALGGGAGTWPWHARDASPAPSARMPVPASGGRATPIALAVLLPLFAITLYALIGNRAALVAGMTSATASATATDAPADADVSPQAVDMMLARLAERLATPSSDRQADLQGWTLLGRSYSAMQRFGPAEQAFAHAIALAPNDAGLLADRADALAMLQGQQSAGEPERLVAKALQIDPDNVKALAISGSAAYERKDFAAARAAWTKARALSPAGSEMANGLDQSLADLGVAPSPGGMTNTSAPGADTEVGMGSPAQAATTAALGATPVAATAATTVAGTRAGVGASTSPSRISGRVRLSPTLAAQAAPGDTVFVFARAAEGPRMPLAVLRRTVAELPFDFTLDDSLAMSPQMRLSSADRVIVGVRISHSGSALPQPGDLVADSVATGTQASGLQLVIGAVQP